MQKTKLAELGSNVRVSQSHNIQTVRYSQIQTARAGVEKQLQHGFWSKNEYEQVVLICLFALFVAELSASLVCLCT